MARLALICADGYSRSPLEAAALIALPMMPMNAGPVQVASLADRRGCTSQAIYQELIAGDLISWSVAGQWVCVGCAGDDYGATPAGIQWAA